MEPRQPLDDLDIPPCPARLLAGDLVITEIMASPAAETMPPDGWPIGEWPTGEWPAGEWPAGEWPAGEWPAGEWIEIHNPTANTLDLQGVVLGTGSPDDVRTRRVLDSATIEPGQYLVLDRLADADADADDDTPDSATPPITDGALPDQGGRVTLRCDVIELDSVTYAAAQPGVARGFSGGLAPDAETNDEPGTWCAATSALAPGLLGSPGAANEVCPDSPANPGDPDSGMCNHGGALRARIVPAPGDLVITELMPNPAAGADADAEWIELHVNADVDLSALAVGREPGTPRAVLDSDACLFAPQGTLVLIAASADPAANGGLPSVDHVMNLGLVNSNGSLYIGVGDTVLDRVTWATSAAGASLSLDPAALSPEANDAPASWCTSAGNAYGSGDIGTPGAPNPACAAPPDGDTCRDGDTVRAIVPPAPGQLHITEYMPDPAAVSDTAGEWIELRVDADADLNGLTLGKAPGTPLMTLASETCLRATAGSHLLLARGPDPATNGGLDPVLATLGFSLTNSSGSLFVAMGDQVLDMLSYTASTPGVATSLDEDAASSGTPRWCPSPASAYGPGGIGDRGTPGAANPPCPTTEQ